MPKTAATTNMPVLTDSRRTVEITLPSYEDSKVVVYETVLVKDFSNIAGLKEEEATTQEMLDVISHYIKSWNFTNEEGKDLEVNAENLGLLKAEDVLFLMEEIAKIAEQSKKEDTTSPQ